MKPVIKIALTAALALLALCGAASANMADILSGYAALKYMPPVTRVTSDGKSFDIEAGLIFYNRWFVGFDGGYGAKKHDGSDNDHATVNAGGGVNFGHIWELPHDLKLSAAGFAGLWHARYENGNHIEDDYSWVAKWGVAGASVRLRWRMIELSYRGIFGDTVKGGDYHISSEENESKRWKTSYISQLMIGLYIGRWR